MTSIELSPEYVSASSLDALPWGHQTGRYRALGHDFALRATDPLVGRYLESVLRPLAAPGLSQSIYSAVDRGPDVEPRHALYLGGERVVATSDRTLFCKLVTWHVNQEAVRRTPTHLLVHASGAEHEGRALLFPAPTKSGKTTLVAGLVQAGLGYITDEAVAIATASLHVDPYPRSLSIEDGSFGLLPSLRPTLAPELADLAGDQWQVDPCAIRAGAIAPPSLPAYVIAPRFTAGATTRMERISRAEALVLLARNAFNLHELGRLGFETASAVCRRSTCFRLSMGDLDSAVRAVFDVLGASTAPDQRQA